MTNPLSTPPMWTAHAVVPAISYSDRPGFCVCWDCRAWRERNDLLDALEEIVAATERWNASVEAVIGRQPSTAIDLINARAAIAAVKGE